MIQDAREGGANKSCVPPHFPCRAAAAPRRDDCPARVASAACGAIGDAVGAARGPGFGSPDPHADSNRRYVEGQRLYFREAGPHRHAGVVVDQNDLGAPFVERERAPSLPKTSRP